MLSPATEATVEVETVSVLGALVAVVSGAALVAVVVTGDNDDVVDDSSADDVEGGGGGGTVVVTTSVDGGDGVVVGPELSSSLFLAVEVPLSSAAFVLAVLASDSRPTTWLSTIESVLLASWPTTTFSWWQLVMFDSSMERGILTFSILETGTVALV